VKEFRRFQLKNKGVCHMIPNENSYNEICKKRLYKDILSVCLADGMNLAQAREIAVRQYLKFIGSEDIETEAQKILGSAEIYSKERRGNK